MIADATRTIAYSYLDRQFPDPEPYLDDLRRLVKSGDFTLGYPVRELEGRVIAFSGLPHAVGVASGTDALTLSLAALGVGPGDEVITATNSFVASAGAIAVLGAVPVLVDVDETLTIDPLSVARAITPRTRAIVPVHLTGTLADMPAIMRIAQQHRLVVVEDAAQAMGATRDGKHAGAWGDAAGVSFHPLKMLNVWGDGGVVLTRHHDLDQRLRLLRNHGLETRDDAVCFGWNGRLSSLQAVIANRVIRGLGSAIARRRELATMLTTELDALNDDGCVRTPVHHPGVLPTYATYQIRAERRDALKAYLLGRGIDVKVHYPVPIHLQTVGRSLGYREGDCPVAERQAREILTLPLHEYLADDDIAYMAAAVRAFYQECP